MNKTKQDVTETAKSVVTTPQAEPGVNAPATSERKPKKTALVGATPTPSTEEEITSPTGKTEIGVQPASHAMENETQPGIAQSTATGSAKAGIGDISPQPDGVTQDLHISSLFGDSKEDEEKVVRVGVQQGPCTQAPTGAAVDRDARKKGDKTEKTGNETTKVADDAPNSDKEQEQKPAIPEYRKTNFEGFKNRFSKDESIYAIDVLVADGDLENDIRRELLTRRAKTRNGKRGAQVQVPKASVQPMADGWIQRVRIQSRPIIHHLSKAVGESWPTGTPVTFFRPFRVLIYFHDQMKKSFADLESKWAYEESHQSKEQADKGKVDGKGNGNDGPDLDEESSDPIEDSIEAFKDMRCYVDFVTRELLPLYKQFDGTALRKVRFDDLWFLFKVGDLVWASDAMTLAAPGSRNTDMYQPLWRIYSIDPPIGMFRYPKLDDTVQSRRQNTETDDENENDNPLVMFTLWAYYIDFDGNLYGAVTYPFHIRRYSGEREIQKLRCYPIRFEDDSGMHIEELTAQGKTFDSYLTNNYLTHNGWTLISTPDGNAMTGKRDPSSRQRQLQTEFIDSHVIVDHAEAFHDMADWRPAFRTADFDTTPRPAAGFFGSRVSDDFAIITWSDEGRSRIISKSLDEVEQKFDSVCTWQKKIGLDMDMFLKAATKQSLTGKKQSRAVLGLDDYALLPRRLFAYVLKDRKFVCVDIQNLNPIKRQVDVFRSLKIENKYKAMVKGLVSSHFAKKKLEKRYFDVGRTSSQSQDIIHGKGRGLVILLHGVPGVGKTATAEAVAMEYNKPLFAITCGDLGLTPKDVEGSLTEIFRLAHMWNCILLFDEADVFLAQRSRFDLTRNALVSVFLRILEYYNGILFLTTNRVGTLDEAFKSRIHMSFYYPPLNEVQIGLIFKLNIEKLRQIEKQRAQMLEEPELDIVDDSIVAFAETHCVKTEQGGRWNGRQIRNAFQIASSLARHDYEEFRLKNKLGHADLKPPVLNVEQFRKVENAIEEFTRYLEDTKGYNDADLAQILGERNDCFRQKRPGTTIPASGPSLSAGAYDQQTSYNQSYGMTPNRAGENAGPGFQYPAGYQGPMRYGHPEYDHAPGGHGAGGPYSAPTRPHPGPSVFETPPASGSAGRGNGFGGNMGGGQMSGYGDNSKIGLRRTQGYKTEEYE